MVSGRGVGRQGGLIAAKSESCNKSESKCAHQNIVISNYDVLLGSGNGGYLVIVPLAKVMAGRLAN